MQKYIELADLVDQVGSITALKAECKAIWLLVTSEMYILLHNVIFLLCIYKAVWVTELFALCVTCLAIILAAEEMHIKIFLQLSVGCNECMFQYQK